MTALDKLMEHLPALPQGFGYGIWTDLEKYADQGRIIQMYKVNPVDKFKLATRPGVETVLDRYLFDDECLASKEFMSWYCKGMHTRDELKKREHVTTRAYRTPNYRKAVDLAQNLIVEHLNEQS